ncbi:hypothetical protein U5801_26965, partial [Lamprobacter modestohalophilus]|uniref:hypothetical protein n=1 Tax=Lamprobacter modestohalophilus TaxID=1064514 RepID=UPI002ADEB0F9
MELAVGLPEQGPDVVECGGHGHVASLLSASVEHLEGERPFWQVWHACCRSNDHAGCVMLSDCAMLKRHSTRLMMPTSAFNPTSAPDAHATPLSTATSPPKPPRCQLALVVIARN